MIPAVCGLASPPRLLTLSHPLHFDKLCVISGMSKHENIWAERAAIFWISVYTAFSLGLVCLLRQEEQSAAGRNKSHLPRVTEEHCGSTEGISWVCCIVILLMLCCDHVHKHNTHCEGCAHILEQREEDVFLEEERISSVIWKLCSNKSNENQTSVICKLGRNPEPPRDGNVSWISSTTSSTNATAWGEDPGRCGSDNNNNRQQTSLIQKGCVRSTRKLSC